MEKGTGSQELNGVKSPQMDELEPFSDPREIEKAALSESVTKSLICILYSTMKELCNL